MGLRYRVLLLSAICLGAVFSSWLHAEEAGAARVADSSSGDGDPPPSAWSRWLGVAGGGRRGGAFFFLGEVDGVATEKNNLDASMRASRGRGAQMRFVKVERPVQSGKHRLRLIGQNAYAAPIESLFRSGSSYRVEGELEVDLRPNALYRVNGVLQEFRQEVWLEEADSGVRVGALIMNEAVDQARKKAMEGAAYSCCNLRYEGDWISDTNAAGLPFIPAGTPIAIREFARNRIHVLVDGYPMTIGHDYGRKQETKEQFVAKLLIKADPGESINGFPPATQKAIRAGKVLRGMSKDQVIISLGYPRTDMTPVLEASTWKYSTADGYEYEVVWSEDGHLADVRSEGGAVLSVVLQGN